MGVGKHDKKAHEPKPDKTPVKPTGGGGFWTGHGTPVETDDDEQTAEEHGGGTN